MISQIRWSITDKESDENNLYNNLENSSVAGEMNFSDFDIEDGLNDPISSFSCSDNEARSLEENSDLEQDGKYFPNF